LSLLWGGARGGGRDLLSLTHFTLCKTLCTVHKRFSDSLRTCPKTVPAPVGPVRTSKILDRRYLGIGRHQK